MVKWEHPQLGSFTFDRGWEGTIKIPLCARFARLRFEPDEIVELIIEAYDSSETPTDTVVQVTIATVKNAEKLVETGLQALFDDFHGTGPDSGMWWRGDIKHIREIIEDDYPPEILDTRDGLYRLLGDANILIQERGCRHNRPCSIIGFESPIDREHGVGILTNGTEIIGLGYRSDPCAFENR